MGSEMCIRDSTLLRALKKNFSETGKKLPPHQKSVVGWFVKGSGTEEACPQYLNPPQGVIMLVFIKNKIRAADSQPGLGESQNNKKRNGVKHKHIAVNLPISNLKLITTLNCADQSIKCYRLQTGGRGKMSFARPRPPFCIKIWNNFYCSLPLSWVERTGRRSQLASCLLYTSPSPRDS